jgi:hypothetical protein
MLSDHNLFVLLRFFLAHRSGNRLHDLIDNISCGMPRRRRTPGMRSIHSAVAAHLLSSRSGSGDQLAGVQYIDDDQCNLCSSIPHQGSSPLSWEML